MKRPLHCVVATACALAGIVIAGSAQAETYRHHHHHYRHHDDCLRFNKTTGTVAGAAAGGLIGNAVLGGTGGLVVGAVGGGVAGNHLAHNGRKHCH
jgi:nitrate/nitrite transporter NarK